MAMNKEVIEDTGLKTMYHRISKINVDFKNNKAVIEVDNYVSKDYRDKAKKQQDIKFKIDTLIREYEDTQNNNALALSLQEKIQNLQNLNKDLLGSEYSAGTTSIELDSLPEDMSYTGFYNELKKLDTYKDAELI